MRPIALVFAFVAACSALGAPLAAQADADGDGLSDSLEAELLGQFRPEFLASTKDCSGLPARFVPGQSTPTVQAADGTIYGQAFPRAGHTDQVELHFYHLWAKDCGDMGHNLDAEHVSALLSRDQDGKWKALYWYSAAHEDTICDASQIARASVLEAERSGPKVWISRGKHGSFLSGLICKRGCGSDDCKGLEPIAVPAVVNLGEPQLPQAGAVWVDSSQWPLAIKMRRTDFPAERVARAEELPDAAIVWAQPQKRSYQAVIHGGNNAIGGVATGAHATDDALTRTDAALDLADAKTGNALGTASRSTGNSLAKSYGGVKKALGVTAQKVGKALGGSSGKN